MPNWCLNTLHAVGQPERIDEFRIINGQYVAPFSEDHDDAFWRHAHRRLDSIYPSGDLVGDRPLLNLSFSSLIPPAADGRTGWGVKKDVDSDCYPSGKAIDRAPRQLPHRQQMLRCFSIEFDTGWNQPHAWFDTLGEFFPDLTIALGYEERANGLAGVSVWDIKHGFCEEDVRSAQAGAPRSAARRRARAALPPAQRPGRLLAAVLADDAVQVHRHLHSVGPNGLVGGLWPPLFHAARAGAADTFALLLEAGAAPDFSTESGFGLVDILLDVYPDQPRALVLARYAMLERLTAARPELLRDPLASGVAPVELAARFHMLPALSTLARHDALAVTGTMGGWVAHAVRSAPNHDLEPLFDSVAGPSVAAPLADKALTLLALEAARLADTSLLGAVMAHRAHFEPDVAAQLDGSAPLASGQHAAPEIVAAYRAMLAHRAIQRSLAGVPSGARPLAPRTP